MTTVAVPAFQVLGLPDTEGRAGSASAGHLRFDLSAAEIDITASDFGERFFQMASQNEPYTFELSPAGELIVMAPTSWDSNMEENETNVAVTKWRAVHDDYASVQTVPYRLESGATFFPNAPLINQGRYEILWSSECTRIMPGAPDFVAEVRSRTGNVADGLAEMQEWMDGGARFGWYSDPYEPKAHICRAG